MGKPFSPSINETVSAAYDSTTLRLTFPEATVTKAGTNLTTEEAKPTPTLSIAVAALKAAPDTKYLVTALDLDAPFPSFNFMSPILHGLHAGLVPGVAGDDGFAPLEGGIEWMVPYVGPGPPKPSSPHRYLFMIFEQPEGLDAAKIRSLLGFGEEVGIWPRIRWNEEAFEKKLGLGKVLAATYYLTRA
ncbi:PEBP-like protein [Xylaria sp. FL1777]|nr:PEBP-like protein [Xylaria sp. FL1777]